MSGLSPRKVTLIAWSGALSVASFITAGEQTWLLGVSVERLSPLPLLAGLALLAASFSELGSDTASSAVPNSPVPLRLHSPWMLKMGVVLTLVGTAMTARSGLALALSAVLAGSYLAGWIDREWRSSTRHDRQNSSQHPLG